MQKIINLLSQYKYLLFIVLYLVLRLFLLNINSAEWGDSYRILRATEYLSSYSYPDDEKRPPLFSMLLLLNFGFDAITNSRIIMMVISGLILVSFYYLLKQVNLSLTSNQRFLTLVLFAVNPLFLYWSIRIYADSLFLLLMLLALNVFYYFQRSASKLALPLLSVISVLAILTRFEGYLLSIILFISIYLTCKKKYDLLFFLLPLTLLFSLVLLFPQFSFYKNPISSSYVEEVGTRSISLREVFNFTLQYLFLLGNLFTIYFLAFSKNNILKFFKDNLVLLFIVLTHSALAFVWFAAVPRLFLPIVPILCIIFVKSLEIFFNETFRVSTFAYLKNFWRREYLHYIIPILLLLTYMLGQAYLKLPFLLTSVSFFALVCFYSLFSLLLIFSHYKKLFISVLIIFNVLWGYFYISLEKDTLKVLNTATIYFTQNYTPEGNVLTNDISSITRYYLKEKYVLTSLLSKGRDLTDSIKLNNIDYVIITNEQNPEMSFTPSKHPYLTILHEFRQVVGGREFFTYIAKVNEITDK